MKTSVALCLLALLGATAAQAQQPASQPPLRIVPGPDGRPRLANQPDGRLRLLAAHPVPHPAGSYQAQPYALRVQVPAPHPDSAAVVAPGRPRDAMPRQPLPAVKLVPEGRRRGQ
jgi:hypothetical protein